MRTVPSSGRVVVNGLEESLARVLHQGCWSEVRSFGAAVSDFTADGEPDDFEVLQHGQPVARVRWAIGGVHNQLNALATIAAAEHVGVAPALAARALASFQNVKRRMEVRGTVNGITVYDDFAHHPTAIRTTVDGLRAPGGAARPAILAVFEPRSNTMKLGTMKSQLPGAWKRPTWRSATPAASTGTPPRRWRPWARGPRWPTASTRWSRTGGGRGPPRRPHPVHEQRRLWRHSHPVT